MQGTIKFINHKRGLVAVQTENGDFTVFELLGGYTVELGDVISGDLETHAGETLKNLTQDEEMDVFIEDYFCSPAYAVEFISD